MQEGDRIRFTAEGIITTAAPDSIFVAFDGRGKHRANHFERSFLENHAEVIQEPLKFGELVVIAKKPHLTRVVIHDECDGKVNVATPDGYVLEGIPASNYRRKSGK